MTRSVDLLILCEDKQHEAFIRRFFKRANWHPKRMRLVPLPAGGSAVQHVRERYPIELRAVRMSGARSDMVVMTDADNLDAEQRKRDLDDELRNQRVALRSPNERVAVLVPRRNIETWLAYLNGENVEEERLNPYPRLRRERDCDPCAANLWTMCQQGALRAPAPESLQAACDEYNERLRANP